MKTKCDNERLTQKFNLWCGYICVIVILTATSNSAWARCDAEIQEVVRQARAIGNKFEEEQWLKQHQGYQNVDEYFNQRNYGALITSAQEQLGFTRKEISNLRTSKPNEVTGLRLSQELWKQCMLEEDIKRINRRNNPSVQNQTTQNQSQSSQQTQSSQQQSQQAQQQAQQSQQLAAQNQTRADQARQGQRRRHEPENEASHCIQPDFGGLYGGMKNTCDFKVWYTYCGYRPKENSWLTGMSCEKQTFGSDSVSPGRTSASHTKGVEMLYWVACKEPAWALDAEFVPGQGVRARCYTVGGK